MKTINHGVYNLTTIILSSVFVLISCTKVTYPEPSENPVLLTYEAQKKLITVKNLQSIDVGKLDNEMIIGDDYITIRNDWAAFTIASYLPDNILQIVVKENTTGKSRTHSVSVISRTKGTTLTVTQAGKP